MHIAVVSPLRTGASGGLIKHKSRLLAHWERNPRVSKISVFLPEGITMDGVNSAHVIAYPATDIKQQFRVLRGLVAAQKPDVALLTIGRYVDLGSVPVVTTVCNAEPVQPMDYSCSLYWQARVWMIRREHRLACTRSTRVLAVSDYIKQQVVDSFGLDPLRVDAVPHGIDQEEIANAGTPPAGLPSSFVFTAGVLAPYRGVEDLVHAVAKLRAIGMTVPPVIMAGSDADAGYVRYLHRLIDALGVRDLFLRLGNISAAEMIWCYKHCLGFVYTSRAEACPNIVLESLAHGCATISCDHQPMPEFYGDAAWYYPCGNHTLLADQLARLLDTSETARQTMRLRARDRVERYTWTATANNMLESLCKATKAAAVC